MKETIAGCPIKIESNDAMPEGIVAMVANGSDAREKDAIPSYVIAHLQKGVIVCDCGHDRFQFVAERFPCDEDRGEYPQLICCRCENRIDV